jgi:MFS family permease
LIGFIGKSQNRALRTSNFRKADNNLFDTGMYTGFFYLSFYGKATGYTSASLSFYVVAILNSGSVFGRTLPNILSDKIGPLNVIVPGAFGVSLILFCALAVHNAAGLIAIAVMFGFFSGVFIALPPVILVALTKDKSRVGTRMGMAFAVIGLGVLAGGPGAGAILGTEGGMNWTGTWVYAGLSPLVGACLFITVRVLVMGRRVMVRV